MFCGACSPRLKHHHSYYFQHDFIEHAWNYA